MSQHNILSSQCMHWQMAIQANRLVKNVNLIEKLAAEDFSSVDVCMPLP